ncbi:MAG: NUDIX hydrolase [Bacteroidota bacterium]
MIQKQATLELLQNYLPTEAAEVQFRQQMLDFIEKYPENFWSRQNQVGHLTASAWITSPDREQTLLIYHHKLQRWLQPGGHLEAEDEMLLGAALREAEEECGVKGFQPISEAVFDLDIHTIPARRDVPEHLHLDTRFCFILDPEVVLTRQAEEVEALRWFTHSELEQINLPDSLRRMMSKVRMR